MVGNEGRVVGRGGFLNHVGKRQDAGGKAPLRRIEGGVRRPRKRADIHVAQDALATDHVELDEGSSVAEEVDARLGVKHHGLGWRHFQQEVFVPPFHQVQLVLECLPQLFHHHHQRHLL